MTAARLTAAEARALGLPAPKPAPRTTRRVARGVKYHTICTTCREEFTTTASEDRHLEATRHARYEIHRS